MAIEKIKQGEKVPFTQVSNELLTDPVLSLKEKGLLAYMLSKPNDWHFHVKAMATELKENKDTVASILKELIAKQYVIRIELRESGQFKGYEYSVYQSPYPKTSDTVKQPPKSPYPKTPVPDSSDNTNKDSTNINTDLKKGGGVVDDNTSRDDDTPGSSPPPVVDVVGEQEAPPLTNTSPTSAPEVGETKEVSKQPILDLLAYNGIHADKLMKTRLRDFIAKYDVDTLENLIKQALVDGKKPDYFNTDFLPYLNSYRSPKSSATMPRCEKHGHILSGGFCNECEHERRKKAEHVHATGMKCPVCHKPGGIGPNGEHLQCMVAKKVNAKPVPATGKPDLQLVKAG
jgi:hypothetical protein